uniref:Uncharacterized protein n=1 Tax=Psilocybe cubensis TaxID=181762 RepID=A0A8H7XWW5_PSICU
MGNRASSSRGATTSEQDKARDQGLAGHTQGRRERRDNAVDMESMEYSRQQQQRQQQRERQRELPSEMMIAPGAHTGHRERQADAGAMVSMDSTQQQHQRRRQRQLQPEMRIPGPPQGDHAIATAAMFGSAENTQVHGGTFTAHHGPQASFVVNIHNGPQTPLGSEAQRHQTGGRPRRARSPRDHPLPPIPPQEEEPIGVRHHQSVEPRIRCVQRSNQVYEQHLLQKGRGHPLWIPQPNIHLPTPYRVKGVCIGDVGIITSDGAFDFLFNICLSATDPIHSGQLPAGFVPVDPPLGVKDTRAYKEFTNGSYLASSTIQKVLTQRRQVNIDDSSMSISSTNIDVPFSGFSFESSASEGSVLTMPEGAYKEELNNISKFRNHIAIHAESWYRFANGPCGREIQNGDLRLVIGCDKTTYWGIATFYDVVQQKNLRLHYVARQGADGRRIPDKTYSWEHNGGAEVRVGPDREENDDILSEPGQGPLLNQCLFLRTLTVTLSEDLWHGVQRSLGVDVKVDESEPSSGSTSQTQKPSPAVSTQDTSYLRREIQGSRNHSNQSTSLAIQNADNVIIQPSTPSSKPEAKVAIVNDKDWYSILSSNVNLQSLRESQSGLLLSEIRKTNDIYVSDGVVYLEPKGQNLESLSPETVSLVNELIDGSIPLLDYLFGRSGRLQMRHKIVKELGLKILENFVIDGDGDMGTLRKQLEGMLYESHNNFADALQNLLEEISTMEPEVELRWQTNDASHRAFLEVHPRSYLCLDDIIRSIKVSRATSLPIQLAPLETIQDLRDRFHTYSTSFVVESQISLLLKLANSLLNRYLNLHQSDDLDQAIFYYEEAYTSWSPIQSYQQVEALLGLCSSHYWRLLLTHKVDDLIALIKLIEAQSNIDRVQLTVPKRNISNNNDTQLAADVIMIPARRPETYYSDNESFEYLIFDDTPELESSWSYSINSSTISPDIRNLMSKELEEANRIFQLGVTRNIIEDYLVDCFRKIKEAHPKRKTLSIGEWPQGQQIQTLVNSALGRFVYPMTVMRYVSSSRHSPADRLNTVLNDKESSEKIKSLCMLILHEAPDNHEIHRILNFIAIGKNFIWSPRNMEEYLFLNPGDVRRLMLDLDPLLEIVDDETAIKFRHPSFPDMLTGSSMSYRGAESVHEEFVYLCIRHIKRFHQPGCPSIGYTAAVEYSINNISEHILNSASYDQEFRSTISEVPYVESLINGMSTIHSGTSSTKLLCAFWKALNRKFHDDAYRRQRDIWDQSLLSRLEKLSPDFAVTFCISLVATKWRVVNPLNIIRHLSAITYPKTYQDAYSLGQFLYYLRENDSQHNSWTPDDEYRQLLLNFFFDSSRSKSWYLDQSKISTVAEVLMNFMVRPWDDTKRSISILLAFSHLLKHIGYKKELVDTLSGPNLLFRVHIVKKQTDEVSDLVKTVIDAVEEYMIRNGTGSAGALFIHIRDDAEKTLAVFGGNKGEI